MPVSLIQNKARARSEDVNQVIRWLTGDTQSVAAVSLTGFTSSSSYNTTIANRDPVHGRALDIRNYARTASLMTVDHHGTKILPFSASEPALTVYKSTGEEAFSVTDDGITTGSESITTDTNAQVLSNKTLTAPIINSGRVGDFLDVTHNTPAPSAPSSQRIRLYALTGSNFLRIKTSGGDETIVADLESVQTMLQKTLTAPNIQNANITDYILLSNNAGFTPGAGKISLYESSNMLRYRRSDTTDLAVASLDGTEEFTNKTYTNPTLSGYWSVGQIGSGAVPSAPGVNRINLYSIEGDTTLKYKTTDGNIHTVLDNLTSLSGVTFSSPVITNFEDYAHLLASPTAPTAGYSRISARNDGNVYLTLPSPGGTTVFLTAANTPAIGSLSMARSISLGGL